MPANVYKKFAETILSRTVGQLELALADIDELLAETDTPEQATPETVAEDRKPARQPLAGGTAARCRRACRALPRADRRLLGLCAVFSAHWTRTSPRSWTWHMPDAKFFEVHEMTKSPLAREALDRIAALYRIEAEILDERTCIDNSAAERAMRPVALGRRNWTFAGSDAGAERAAAIYSLIETAKLHGLDPEAHLRRVIEQIADHPINRVHALLPWNLDSCKAR